MPHQCLQCGHVFAEGSSALLAGCPDCKGTRFFYTAKAVDAAERQKLADQAQKDLRQVVTEMLAEAAPDVAKEMSVGEDGWAELRPKDLRRLVKHVKQERAAQEEAPHTGASERYKQALRQLEAADEESHPDTVTIREPGAYDIDVKALLEKNPIVVQKDGSYMIHLASLFPDKS
jgi:predicted  nucleic acid-binding Zn-ribbon protein